MNYPKKTGFNLYQSRHCAYITYTVKTWFLKILSVSQKQFILSSTMVCKCWNTLNINKLQVLVPTPWTSAKTIFARFAWTLSPLFKGSLQIHRYPAKTYLNYDYTSCPQKRSGSVDYYTICILYIIYTIHRSLCTQSHIVDKLEF